MGGPPMMVGPGGKGKGKPGITIVNPPFQQKGAQQWGKGGGGGWGKDNSAWGKGSWGKDSWGKGKGKDKGKPRRPSGPGLPRQRITEAPVTGEVVEWKGKYGWIQPTVAIEHEQASKREGKIYVSMSDLVGVTELSPGSLAQFHVFVDSSGLGAEECIGS
mmetsp:Transcript_84803/g.229817  ORF Transcript_84803/g.229817 Transcript_84803/m.229817 type:complete len:160 (-) Transcript_84803:112-591(-)